ncbi:hypothetical protein BN3662_03003 [Clostridiales bacterium CHKCI006]|nr:hypothetical protein BN3662_03003 [Clostridiales bacterium CHKCI006]
MNRINIYIATHKQFDVPNMKGYIPLHVGAYNKDNIGYVTDNTGDNISQLNPFFCELTGLYWIWKNVHCEYVGLVHYRRYFSLLDNFGEIISTDRMLDILKTSDVIVPYPKKFNVNIKTQYWMSHYLSDLLKVKKIIAEIHPEYIKAFNWVMSQKQFHPYNMFVAKKEIIDKYCEWLFSILFEFQNSIDISDYNPYQSRLYGFISERLFNVWLKQEKLNTFELPVVNTDQIKDSNLSYNEDFEFVSYFYMFRHLVDQILGHTKF